MVYAANTFLADVTIPGLSRSDLVRRAVSAIQSGLGLASNGLSLTARDRALRRALADLDAHQLRDLGFDRDAC